MIERENRKVTEVIIGVNRDPQWGPMLMVGTGGIYANYMNDVSFELTPGYTKKEAEAQLKRTRVYKILKGVRGEAESDVDAVLETMMKGPSLGMYSSSSCRMSADMRNVFMAALVNSLPRNSPNSGYRRLMRFSPIMDMAQEAAREPAGPFRLRAF